MIEMHLKYDNMHRNGMFYALFCINNHFDHVKIACYQHSSCGILSLFPPLFFSLMRWISIARSSFVFFFFPFSFHLSASPSFSYDKNIPVTRRGKSLLFIIFSPYFFFFSLFPSPHCEEALRVVVFLPLPSSLLAPALLASLPRPHVSCHQKKKEKREDKGDKREERENYFFLIHSLTGLERVDRHDLRREK